MTTQVPTRITLEFRPPIGDAGDGQSPAPVVRVVSSTPGAVVTAVASEPRETPVVPAEYVPAPCTCPDDGCAADHKN